MKNLKIGHRLGIAFGVNVLLLLFIAFLGLNGIRETFRSVESIYGDSLIPFGDLTEIEFRSMRNRIVTMDMILNSDPENVSKRANEQTRNAELLRASLKEFLASDLSAEEKRLVGEFVTANNIYEAQGISPARQAMLAGDVAGASTIYNDRISKLSPKVFELLTKLKELQVASAKKSFEGAAVQYSSTNIFTILTSVATVLFTIVMAWWISRSVTRPMAIAVTFASAIANGDLTQKIDTVSKDETGLLLSALGAMGNSLQAIVGDVRSGTDSIARSSSEIAAGNLDLSSRTEEQASALEETSSAMAEIMSGVNTNAENAQRANRLAQESSAIAKVGGQSVSDVVATMEEINQASKKIAQIVAVIDGITFQTNILALNAAVEAARAGAEGRGFAVVAAEVRNLAHRSAAAAKEIKTLVDDSVKKVASGGNLVNEAGNTITRVVESVTELASIMSEIEKASYDQKVGLNQINTAILEIDNVTQQNAALVEEAAAAAASLEEQAARVASVVSTFKVARATTHEVPSIRRRLLN